MYPGLTIGQVARQAGVATSALRYYERIGLLPRPERVSGRRRYDQRVVRLVAVIQLAKHAGFTIAEIQTLVHGFDESTMPATRWQTLARDKLVELDRQLEHIQQMKQVLTTGLQCGCLHLEECVIIDGTGCRIQPAASSPIAFRTYPGNDG